MEYHEKKRLIKIIRNIATVIILSIIWHIYATSPSKAYKELDRYLKNKYGEEFVIDYMGRRKVNSREWYEAGIVFPKSYIGTPKENDTYYWGRGFAEIKPFGLDVGDNYGGVLLNESANEFYGKKLKELFGDNVLPVLNIRGEYKYTDFLKEYLREEKIISGGIYIFGRVENNEDREKYREEIYKFVQFMKETGTFEYVDLGILVLDERVLSKEFQENNEIKSELIAEGEKYWKQNRKFFAENVRKDIMKKLPKNLTPYIKLEDINKSEIKNSLKWSYYNNLLTISLYSPKYVKAKNLDKYADIKIKSYNNISDLQFLDEEN